VKFLKVILFCFSLLALQSFSFSNVSINSGTENISGSTTLSKEASQLYESLQLKERGLSQQAFSAALKAMRAVSGDLTNCEVITIADFSQSCNSKRLYIIDLVNSQVLFQTYVAHGRNSGEEFATSFSDKPSSYKSSLGCYITGDSYIGANGYSLRLEGKEPGYNHHAFDRAVVLHGANYVSEDFIQSNGRLGRSLGCPAVPFELTKPIIETIKNGSCFFIYYPDQRYFKTSALMKSAA
jgi:hypothetical protein